MKKLKKIRDLLGKGHEQLKLLRELERATIRKTILELDIRKNMANRLVHYLYNTELQMVPLTALKYTAAKRKFLNSEHILTEREAALLKDMLIKIGAYEVEDDRRTIARKENE